MVSSEQVVLDQCLHPSVQLDHATQVHHVLAVAARDADHGHHGRNHQLPLPSAQIQGSFVTVFQLRQDPSVRLRYVREVVRIPATVSQ